MLYTDYKKQTQQKFDIFITENIFFAFSNEQFEEGQKKFPNQKLSPIGSGGYCLTSKIEEFKKLNTEAKKALKEHCKDLKFVKSMFVYELNNHEYGYTGEIDQTLETLDITEEEVEANQTLSEGLKYAKEYVRSQEW